MRMLPTWESEPAFVGKSAISKIAGQGVQHSHRYPAEFDFRYNALKLKDGDQSLLAFIRSGWKVTHAAGFIRSNLKN